MAVVFQGGGLAERWSFKVVVCKGGGLSRRALDFMGGGLSRLWSVRAVVYNGGSLKCLLRPGMTIV